MKTYQTDDAKPLGFTEYEVLKAIPRSLVTMRPGDTALWRHHDGYTVTSTMLTLIERGYVRPDTDFTNGRRGARITAAGYAAMSYAARHKPSKRGT